MKKYLCVLLLLCTSVQFATAQDRAPNAPEWLVEVAEDVRLGARLEGGIFHSRLSIAPLEGRGLRYLGRPVRSELSPVTTPFYGASAGLRWTGGIELFGAYRLDSGIESDTYLRFQDGERAIPAAYDVRQWTLRVHYFLFEGAGLGVLYRGERASLDEVGSFRIAGMEISNNIFSTSSKRRSLSLYVPVRIRLGHRMVFLGRLGASVYGRGDDSYNSRFTYYQNPERPDEIFPVPPDDEDASIRVEPLDLGYYFAGIGIESSFSALAGRVLLSAERVRVGDVSEEWRGGLRMQVGLPF